MKMTELKIEAGKYYRTRDGQKVGPMNVPPVGRAWISQVIADAVPQGGGLLGWCADGFYNASGKPSQNDLVAEWRGGPDLTAITTPFGLLDRETQEALKAHGGPYEMYDGGDAGWQAVTDPSWVDTCTYRVKPAPPKPREMTAVWNAGRSCFEIHVTNIVIPHMTAMTVTGVLPE